jgi:hypothetical protein
MRGKRIKRADDRPTLAMLDKLTNRNQCGKQSKTRKHAPMQNIPRKRGESYIQCNLKDEGIKKGSAQPQVLPNDRDIESIEAVESDMYRFRVEEILVLKSGFFTNIISPMSGRCVLFVDWLPEVWLGSAVWCSQD